MGVSEPEKIGVDKRADTGYTIANNTSDEEKSSRRRFLQRARSGESGRGQKPMNMASELRGRFAYPYGYADSPRRVFPLQD